MEMDPDKTLGAKRPVPKLKNHLVIHPKELVPFPNDNHQTNENQTVYIKDDMIYTVAQPSSSFAESLQNFEKPKQIKRFPTANKSVPSSNMNKLKVTTPKNEIKVNSLSILPPPNLKEPIRTYRSADGYLTSNQIKYITSNNRYEVDNTKETRFFQRNPLLSQCSEKQIEIASKKMCDGTERTWKKDLEEIVHLLDDQKENNAKNAPDHELSDIINRLSNSSEFCVTTNEDSALELVPKKKARKGGVFENITSDLTITCVTQNALLESGSFNSGSCGNLVSLSEVQPVYSQTNSTKTDPPTLENQKNVANTSKNVKLKSKKRETKKRKVKRRLAYDKETQTPKCFIKPKINKKRSNFNNKIMIYLKYISAKIRTLEKTVKKSQRDDRNQRKILLENIGELAKIKMEELSDLMSLIKSPLEEPNLEGFPIVYRNLENNEEIIGEQTKEVLLDEELQICDEKKEEEEKMEDSEGPPQLKRVDEEQQEFEDFKPALAESEFEKFARNMRLIEEDSKVTDNALNVEDEKTEIKTDDIKTEDIEILRRAVENGRRRRNCREINMNSFVLCERSLRSKTVKFFMEK